MTAKRLYVLLGSICLALMLVVPFVAACAGPAPTPTPSPSPSPTASPSPSPSPAPAPTEEVFQWKFQSHMVATDPLYYSTLTTWVNMVEKLSDGRMKIALHPGGTIVASPEILGSVKNRVVEVGGSTAVYWKGSMPEVGVLLFPMALQSDTDGSDLWFSQGLHEFMVESYANQGVHLLTCLQGPNLYILTSEPIRTLDDFEGMMVRTHSGNAALIEAFGAKAVSVIPEEIYTGLQLGTFDGLTWSGYASYYRQGFYEIAKYVMDYPVLTPNIMSDELFVNPEAWEELPDDIKGIMQLAADYAHFNNALAYRIEERECKGYLAEAGVEFTQLSESEKAEMMEVAQSYWTETANMSPRAKQAVKLVTDFLRMKGYTDYKIE